jgi:archaellum component FlaF (FlaF/FlaG flagellin family)
MLFQNRMRPRLYITSFAGACALLVPVATAHAGSTQLHVRSCEAGDTPKHRAATYYARMYAVKGTNTMAMRFTLLNKAGDGPPTVVDNPSLSQWRKSRAKVKRFGYAQSVEGLEKGGVYAVQVQFRWLDSHGKVIRSIKRTSRSCRQQGSLPNLSITRVTARAGSASGTEVYNVDVTNSGRGSAQSVGVNLFVDGAAADSYTIDQLKGGETLTVHFTAPSCKQQLRAVADAGDKINETNEDDNTLGSRCPAIG